MEMESSSARRCDYKQGPLPACAPLAAAYVPIQQPGAPKYERADALARGTLFPGLDLPWKNVANQNAGPLANTPLGDLMALDFVVQELGLYLDTHPQDQEALALYTEYVALLKQGRETYVARYGPIKQTQVMQKNGYSWVLDPWPWDLPTLPRGERRDD